LPSDEDYRWVEANYRGREVEVKNLARFW